MLLRSLSSHFYSSRQNRLSGGPNMFLKFYSQILNAKISPQEVVNFEITDSAVRQIRLLHSKNPTKLLRVGVEAGGCHGFQYRYSLDLYLWETNTGVTDDACSDLLFESEKDSDIKLICDSISWKIIKNSKLDYSNELIGSSFQILDNPAASSGCGCGISFDLKEKN